MLVLETAGTGMVFQEKYVVARPDIVLLVLDTQRRDRLSCYGYHHETTPHLDRLATDATVFNHVVSTAQWTVPSHSSMFTSLYPSDHTMYHASSVLSASVETLAKRLGAGGYFTCAFCNNPLLGVVNNGLHEQREQLQASWKDRGRARVTVPVEIIDASGEIVTTLSVSCVLLPTM